MTNPINPYVRPLFSYTGTRETVNGCTVIRLTDGSTYVMKGDTTEDVCQAIAQGKPLIDRVLGAVSIMHPDHIIGAHYTPDRTETPAE